MLAVSLCHSYCSYRRPRYSVTQHGRSATQNIGNHRQILTAAAILTAVFVGSTIFQLQKLKDKCTVHPITGQAAPEGEYRYCSTLSSTSVLDEVRGQPHAPAVLPLGKRHGTHITGDWVGTRAGLDGWGKSRPLPPGFDPRTVQPVESLHHLGYPAHRLQALRNTKRGKRRAQVSCLRWIGTAHGSCGEHQRCVQKFGAETSGEGKRGRPRCRTEETRLSGGGMD